MANEIRFSGSLRYTEGVESATLTGSGTADQTGTEYVQATQEVGLVEEQIAKGDIGVIGWCAFRNLDATHFVELGATTGVYTIKLKAGATAIVPWDGSTVYALADTSICQIEYLMIEA